MLDTPLLRIENLRVTFETADGPVEAVQELSFDINPGETVCVVGESGSGKSVASLALMRLVEFSGGDMRAGQILFDRNDLAATDLAAQTQDRMRAIRGNEISLIFQEPMTALNPVFTVERQLTEGLRLHTSCSRAEARAKALDLLREVRIPEPEKRLGQHPHELSGGMRQRVMIAMALACRPRLLIADEPTTALDVTIQAEILTLIDRLKQETGAAVIFITHDMAVVAEMADRVVVMQNGRKVEEGPVQRIFSAPEMPYTRALLDAVPRLGEMRGTPGPKLPARANNLRLPTQLQQRATAPLLEVENLTCRFPVAGGLMRRLTAEVHAVQDVTFNLGRTKTLSLVGESGCGKSTTGRAILRLIEPTSGRVRLSGQNILAFDDKGLRQMRRNMQMVFQDPFGSFNPQKRLLEQVAEPLRNFGMASGTQVEDMVATLFDKVRLPRDLLRRYPHELSGGQRQRAAIARAIAPHPKLIVADEAVSALDVSVQARVLDLMLELQADMDMSFLFISHDMAVVERISHDVAVMYLGRIVEIGPRAAIFENPQHAYTKALLLAVPIADPKQRRARDLNFKPVPTAVHHLDFDPEPSVYREISPGHHVLTSPREYE